MFTGLFNIDFLLLGIAIAGNLVLGFVVFFNQKKSATNKLLFAFSAINSIWSLVTYLSYITTEKQTALWLVRLVMFFATIHGSLFFFLVNAFPGEKLRMNKKYVYIILSFVILTMIISLTPFLFSDISFVQGEVPQPKPAPGIVVFIFVTISAIIMGISSLIKRTVKSSGIEKKYYKYLLVGAIIMFASILSLDFLLPSFFNDTRFIPLSALFTLPFVVSVAYAIIKHKLFNVKVAGAAILVFALSVVTFIEVILADNFIFILYRAGILLLVLSFGILLIKSVLREVEQREEIARMAEDVRRAYVIEKKAKEELEVLDKIKDQFVMTTQHNLRTPLTSMMGYTDLLLQGAFGKQNKKTTEVIKRFQTSTQNLIKMVNNFLDMAQFQLGKSVVILKSGVDVVSAINEIVNDLSFKAENKGIKLNFDKPKKEIKIKADREKLKAALFNIIDNAVKYTPKGEVNVRVELKSEIRNSKFETNSNDQNSKPSVLVTVKDTGIGIAKDKLGSIFEQIFERSEEAKKIASMGSGVGLYLSGEIVKSHNGKAWAESEGEGKGSTFFVELPLDDGKPMPPSAPPAPGKAPPVFTKATNKDITPAAFVKAATPSQPVSKN